MASNTHPAAALRQRLPLVFTAHSAETAYLKEIICVFVLREGRVPVNPFMSYGYFLYGMVDKDTIRSANNNLVARCDELWTFGAPSDGVLVEIEHEMGLFEEIKLDLELPIVDYRADDVYGRIVSTKQIEGRHRFGVEFTSVSAESSRNIHRLVHMLIQGMGAAD